MPRNKVANLLKNAIVTLVLVPCAQSYSRKETDMKQLLIALLCLTGILCQAEKMPDINARELALNFKTDKSPVAYRTGEKILMTVSLDYGKQKDVMPKFFLQWTCSSDDGQMDAGMNEIAPGKDITVAATLSKPGFVRFVGILLDQYGRSFAYLNGNQRVEVRLDCGVGADIEKILPAGQEPADFRAFWKKQRKLLNTVPVMPVLKKLDETKFVPKKFAGKFDVWEVTVPCAGPRPVTGHLIMLKNAKEKSLPAQVSFDGYGPGAQGEAPSIEWFYIIASDKILFKINAHGYDLGQDDAYYKKFFAERPSYAMIPEENDNPETAYFHGMALRVMRAFDFVKTLPQWDGKNLIAQGGSQGGLQAAWAGSLVPELTVCRPHVTWCCDINGTAAGRMGGWRPDFRPGLAYYDAVFHTRYIPKTCLLDIDRIGLGDYVCPPSGLAAQYNAAVCPKQALWMQNSTHMGIPPGYEKFAVSAPASDKEPPRGVAENSNALLASPGVKADFDPAAWMLTVNGKTEKIQFSGRENLKKRKNLQTMDKVILEGVLNVENDGVARIGVGADWWWELYVNEKPVYGRIQALPGGNCKATFEKTDWIVPAEVKKGANKIRLEVILGENGTVATGVCKTETVDADAFRQYWIFKKKYPVPSKETEYSHQFFNRNCIDFESAQPYPAAIEVLRKGEKNWRSFRSLNFSTDHTVKLPFDLQKGDSVRIAQYAYLGGWQIFRTEPEVK